MLVHPLKPIFNSESKVLILGSFPSPKSRENGFYYSHNQNRFWKLITEVFGNNHICDNDKRTEFLLKNKIALWDVLRSCEIVGASDSSIKNPTPNDLKLIYDFADIKATFATGKTAYNLYKNFFNENVFYLPSPSPANCSISYDKLLESYKKIKDFL